MRKVLPCRFACLFIDCLQERPTMLPDCQALLACLHLSAECIWKVSSSHRQISYVPTVPNICSCTPHTPGLTNLFWFQFLFHISFQDMCQRSHEAQWMVWPYLPASKTDAEKCEIQMETHSLQESTLNGISSVYMHLLVLESLGLGKGTIFSFPFQNIKEYKTIKNLPFR